MVDDSLEIQLILSSFDPTKNSIRLEILQGSNGFLVKDTGTGRNERGNSTGMIHDYEGRGNCPTMR